MPASGCNVQTDEAEYEIFFAKLFRTVQIFWELDATSITVAAWRLVHSDHVIFAAAY